MSDEELAEWLAVCDRPSPDGILMSRYTLRQILVEAERRGAELAARIDAMRAVVEAAKRDRDEWFEGYCDKTDCVRCDLYRAVEACREEKEQL